MVNNFSMNLLKLASKYTQKQIAEKTGFSQSSINNYISKASEPSIQFLIALKEAYGFSADDFLFSNIEEKENNAACDRFLGHYMVYFYDNSAYRGEIHNNLKTTLNYGVISIMKQNNSYVAYSTFTKHRVLMTNLFNELKKTENVEEVKELHSKVSDLYEGDIHANDQNFFIHLESKEVKDECFIVFNNPPTKSSYIGGLGTINSISRGREKNPCLQYLIVSRNILDKPDGEIYNMLCLDKPDIDFTISISELTSLFKRLYMSKNDMSSNLSEAQKENIIENTLKNQFQQIMEANMFRFAKISNKEDDKIYKLIKEEQKTW